MGIYVCEKCLREYQLTPTVWTSSNGACEVCGELRGDWSPKFCVYCPTLDRFNLKEELKDEIDEKLEILNSHLFSLCFLKEEV